MCLLLWLRNHKSDRYKPVTVVCAFDSQRQADVPNQAVEMQGDPVSKKSYNYFKLIPKTKPNMILNSLPIYVKLTLCHWAIHQDQAFTSPTLRVFILKYEIISSLLIHYYILVITIIMNVKWQNGQVTKLLLKF